MTRLQLLRQFADQQQFAELKALARACWSETGEPGTLPLLALAQAQLGERGEAAQLGETCRSRIGELDNDARVDLAAVDCLFWRIDEAIELLEHVLAAEPEHSLALARLAWCRMQQGQLDEARTLYQRSAKLAPLNKECPSFQIHRTLHNKYREKLAVMLQSGIAGKLHAKEIYAFTKDGLIRRYAGERHVGQRFYDMRNVIAHAKSLPLKLRVFESHLP
jgi:tetratricopeptide (TPR) repeat protein